MDSSDSIQARRQRELAEREAFADIIGLTDVEVDGLNPGVMKDILAAHATRLRWYAEERWGAGWDQPPDNEVWHLLGGGRRPFCGAERPERSSLAKACPDCLDAAVLLGDLGRLAADLEPVEPFWSAKDVADVIGEEDR